MDNGASSYRRFREEDDESGLAEIIRDYKDGLIFYLNSILNDLNAAEDAAEDTFVILGTRKPRDKGTGSFKTWLYTIGRNVVIDRMRKQSRKREVPVAEYPEIAADEEAFETAFIRDERKMTVHHAMRRLKPEYRQVLWLVYFEEFSNREAARVLKKSTHNVETLLYRARKALKAELEKEGFTYEEL